MSGSTSECMDGARRRLRFGKQGMLMGFERQPLKVFKYFRRLVSKN